MNIERVELLLGEKSLGLHNVPTDLNLRDLLEIRNKVLRALRESESKLPCDIETIRENAEIISVKPYSEKKETSEITSENLWDFLKSRITNFEEELTRKIEEQAQNIVNCIASIRSINSLSEYISHIPITILKSATFQGKLRQKIESLDEEQGTTVFCSLIIGLGEILDPNKEFDLFEFKTVLESKNLNFTKIIQKLNQVKLRPNTTGSAVLQLEAYGSLINLHSSNDQIEILRDIDIIITKIYTEELLNKYIYQELHKAYLESENSPEERSKIIDRIEKVIIAIIANFDQNYGRFRDLIFDFTIKYQLDIDQLVNNAIDLRKKSDRNFKDINERNIRFQVKSQFKYAARKNIG